jgi:hypothetical protein
VICELGVAPEDVLMHSVKLETELEKVFTFLREEKELEFAVLLENDQIQSN